MRLTGKVAIVTGSASGIGEAIALLFAREGAKVVVVDVQEERGARVVQQIKDEDGEAIFVRTDVSKEDQVKHMVETAVKTYGGIDILCNNAGVLMSKELHETTGDDWDLVMGVDLKGTFWCSKYAVPIMKEWRGGSIVMISSANAIVAEPALAAYCAAKGGVNGMTRAMALDYGQYGIRVNAICPGYIDTPLGDIYFDAQPDPAAARRAAGALHALGRMGTPMEIAYCVLFLACDESSFVTGECLVADGGLSVIVNPAPGFQV
jgi:NAD(P)-dependent dehydrogenase (short-subunit alcohol dehydrogenase family)